MRPPLALHRLSPGPDGTVVYRMKRPWGGSLFLVLMPDQLVARLAAMVPPAPTPSGPSNLDRPGARLTNPTPPPGRAGRRNRVPWADLLRKVFSVHVQECPGCGGRLEVLAFITEQAVGTQPSRRLRPRGPRLPEGADEAPCRAVRGRASFHSEFDRPLNQSPE
jgi:hypothetical protein